MIDIRKMGTVVVAYLLLAHGASAAIMTYSDRTSFQSTLSQFTIDTYSDPGYVFIQNDAKMSAVFGETDYRTTGFNNLNIVNSGRYCAGCNGSFELSFMTTSVGDATGVFGVGFDITHNSTTLPYDAFAVFGDGSTMNFDLGTGVSFFGLTADSNIKSLHLGLPNGGVTQVGSFQIDNLTIGVPEPTTLVLLGLGLAGIVSSRKR